MKQAQLFCAILLMAVTLKAQTPDVANASLPESEKEIVAFTRKFYLALEEAQNTGIVEPAMQMLDKNYTSTRHILDVDGRQTKAVLSIQDFRSQLNARLSIKGLAAKFKIESVNFVKVYENIATINFTLVIYATLNNEPILSYKSFLTNYLKKDEQGNWRIFESNGINVYKRQEVGLCPCQITQSTKNSDEYSVKVLAPSGTMFKEDVVVFTFKKAEGQTLVMVGENAYTLKGNEVTSAKIDGKVVVSKVGLASTPIEVINLILSNSIYNGKCLGFKQMDK
jgi:hypothetical protein